MSKRRCIPWLLGAAVLTFLPGSVLAQSCGPFTDVSANDVFCPFILQAFIDSVTQGTSPTTFSPNDLLPRNQVVTFFDRVMDIGLHRGSLRTAIGKTWSPTATNGGIATDVGGGISDIVTDGTFLWIARQDGKILKVNVADRRLLETWSLASGIPVKLGIFGGLVWAADNQGALHFFNPTSSPGTATKLFSNLLPTSNLPTLAFDGSNLWLGNKDSPTLIIYPINGPTAFQFTAGGNVDGLVFDGSNMWVLQANSTLLKIAPATFPAASLTVSETLTIPASVNDCRMLYDGTNIWIPTGGGPLFVVRVQPNPSAPPSSIIALANVPGVAFPYVATSDGENVMIGGINNGVVALYKGTSLTPIRSFNTGAAGVRGIASDGRTFNIGDNGGTKFFQY